MNYAGPFYGELKQDVFVLETLKEKQQGFFVEFGAMTGLQYSNTYVLEKHFGWQGIVSEPNPRFHDELLRNRSCTVDNRAVFDKTGKTLKFVCRGHGYSGLAVPGIEYNDQTINVVSVSLNDLLFENSAPGYIDYISMDTEGSELQILKAFDFSRWQVGVWTIEHNFHRDNRQAIQDIMLSNNYCHVKSEQSQYDDWFVHSDLIKLKNL